jgi:hypothetical protein
LSHNDEFRDAIRQAMEAARQSVEDDGISENTGLIVVAVDHTNNPHNRVIVFSDLCEEDVSGVLRNIIAQGDGIGAVMGSA